MLPGSPAAQHPHPIDKGYLLSPRDLCGLDYIKDLIDAGVKCFKIEGRMKTPEYVALTTRTYRKYIDEFVGADDSVCPIGSDENINLGRTGSSAPTSK